MNQDPKPDYSFLNQNEEKTSFLSRFDKKTRVLIVAAGGGVLLIILLLVAALVFGGRTDLKQNLVSIAQRQQEIIRITDIGQDKARSQGVMSFSTTTKASITSSQQKVISSVSNKGRRLGAADLRLRENHSSTQELESAEQANRFDETFIEIMQAELLAYQTLIEEAAQQAAGSDLALLQDLHNEVNLLIASLEQL